MYHVMASPMYIIYRLNSHCHKCLLKRARKITLIQKNRWSLCFFLNLEFKKLCNPKENPSQGEKMKSFMIIPTPTLDFLKHILWTQYVSDIIQSLMAVVLGGGKTSVGHLRSFHHSHELTVEWVAGSLSLLVRKHPEVLLKILLFNFHFVLWVLCFDFFFVFWNHI